MIPEGEADLRVLSWNLFHGRDNPPEPELRTWRSRLLGTTERGTHHAQVNVDLHDRFADLLAEAEWDVALLQECPPRWAESLAEACDADAHLAPTSRNIPLLAPVQGFLADRNPDLIASWEGGSNLTLVRSLSSAGPAITERRSHRLASRPERRTMAFTRLATGLCVANLHASAERSAAEDELPEAARVATGWARGSPLILGGDFNLRPRLSAFVFDALERDHGLASPTGPKAIDHILSRGLEVIEPPGQWPPERREVTDPTAPGADSPPIRLSDHAPVEAAFRRA